VLTGGLKTERELERKIKNRSLLKETRTRAKVRARPRGEKRRNDVGKVKDKTRDLLRKKKKLDWSKLSRKVIGRHT